LPAGLSANTTYYVIASGLTNNAFRIATTQGGTQIDITDAGTGTHSWVYFVDQVAGFLSEGHYGYGQHVLFPSDQFGQFPVWGLWGFPPAVLDVLYDEDWYLENISFPCTYEIVSGALPPGLTLENEGVESQGHVFGIPTALGTYPFTLRATNIEGFTDHVFRSS
jgi:hypothetical protein